MDGPTVALADVMATLLWTEERDITNRLTKADTGNPAAVAASRT